MSSLSSYFQRRLTESAILQRVMKIEFIRPSHIRLFAYFQRSFSHELFRFTQAQ